MVSRIATIGWGLVACLVAMQAASQGSLIEVVNRYGSYVYGAILGVFILAILTKRATSRGAFYGMIVAMIVVVAVAQTSTISYLWYNLIGAAVAVTVGLALSPSPRPAARAEI
jgi:Na+/proline symporter